MQKNRMFLSIAAFVILLVGVGVVIYFATRSDKQSGGGDKSPVSIKPVR